MASTSTVKELNQKDGKTTLKLLLFFAAGILILIAELSLPIKFDTSALYIILPLFCFLVEKKNTILAFGILSLSFLFGGYGIRYNFEIETDHFYNRILVGFVILVVVVWRIIQSKYESKKQESKIKKLQEVSNENKQLLFALHNAALVSITDSKGDIIFANDTFCEISKYSQEELIGQNHRILKSGMQSDGVFIGMWKAISKGRIWRGEICNKAKDGSLYWVYATIIPILDVDGNVDKFAAIRFNITPLKLAEENINLKSIELKRSNEELQKFAYVASHDLQEPLRMVSSYTQLLERRYGEQLDDNAREYIGFAVDGANRMQKLIKDLLEYSRVSTKSKPFSEVDCTKVIEDVQFNLSNAIQESGAKIKAGDLPMLKGEESLLTRLFQNLIGNAIKFVENKTPEIEISCEEKPAHWKFSVSDNGIGISHEYVERIFVIFQRLHTKEEYEGSGMGLAICKRIVERHQGEIWFEPKEDGGSIFIFTISKNLE